MGEKVVYRNPGHGSILFAEAFIIGATDRQESLMILSQIYNGEIPVQDKRVKRCDYCGYYWRDDSLRNTKKTCSDECKTGIKTMQRRRQREKKELLNPEPKKKKHTLMDDYIWWLEYPYWLNEYSMLKIGWKYERSDDGLADYVTAKNEIFGEGNRKKPNRIVDYHGDKRDEF